MKAATAVVFTLLAGVMAPCFAEELGSGGTITPIGLTSFEVDIKKDWTNTDHAMIVTHTERVTKGGWVSVACIAGSVVLFPPPWPFPGTNPNLKDDPRLENVDPCFIGHWDWDSTWQILPQDTEDNYDECGEFAYYSDTDYIQTSWHFDWGETAVP
jgi:hypothetical protein